MEQRNCPVLYIVVPCYNEEEVLPITGREFLAELNSLVEKGKVSVQSRILYVDDGSCDRTWEIIKDFASKDEKVKGISQSRNRGHQNTILAGLMESKDVCDIAITIDCDGQDDITAINDMIDAYRDGCEVVYGVRDDRKSDSFLKKVSAESYYKTLKWLGADVIYNHADYRLISSRVLNALADYKEVNLFLRGLIPLIGFKSTSVYYRRKEREAGKTHYPVSKMLHLAIDGVTSLTIKPLQMIAISGIIISLVSLMGIIWSIYEHVIGNTVSGWSSIVCVICFFSGIQLLSVGIIGIYIGKIYLETKQRPRYIIADRTDGK